MNLPQALLSHRTLVIEGVDGIPRNGLIAQLAHHGFPVQHLPDRLHHVDPTRPYRELLATPGRMALDGSIIHELVYGPLHRGHSRVTWIQALDFAESVAERDGALIHLTASVSCLRPAPSDSTEAADAYARAMRTLAQHVAVVSLDAADLTHLPRPGTPAHRELGRNQQQLTVRW
ncbi:hypothetical protein OG800_02895 [Streptomyces sp. NBC_00445]|uniref:hypothetical protein n=1 Tax=Streptomyces sp. NBC_00445 TaxID=2975745 RepID=UPI002E2138D0